MKVRNLVIASLAVLAAMVGFALYAAGLAPAGAELPTHWNARGEVDGTMPALQALLMPAGLLAFVTLVFAVIPRIEPLQDRLEASAPLLRATWIAMLGFMAFLQGLIAAPLFGYAPAGHLALLPAGVLLVVLGNMLPKSRPGFFVGIRTPWTIVDEDVWIATHRLGGKLMLLAGVLFILTAVLPVEPALRGWIIGIGIAVSVVVPIGYSWWLWNAKHRSGRRTD